MNLLQTRSFCVLSLGGLLLLGSVNLFAFDFSVPQAVKTKYQYLYRLPVEPVDGGFRFHEARLFFRKGLRVLHLRGDRFEMAFQHGKLLKKDIHNGTVPQASQMLAHAVKNGFPQIPLITDIIINSFYRRVTEGIMEYGVDHFGGDQQKLMQEAYGLSEASGLSVKTLIYAALGPESLQTMLGERSDYYPMTPVSSPSQCSAFAAWGSATADGNMIIGRNTDYPLNGYYDRYPTVIYYEPTDGTQKHMAVSSAGIHNSGVVGFNESGIYIGVHTVPTTDVSTEGVPVFFIGQSVLRAAHTLDEAIELFQKVNPPSGWNYLIVSTKEKKAATVELTNKGFGALASVGDVHAQTNHFATEKMKPRYLSVNVSVDLDSVARLRRMQTLLSRYRGKLDPKLATTIMSDKVDPFTGEVRGFPNTVAVHTTMTSVVLEPAQDRLFVAAGTAPVSNTEYVELPLVQSFNPDTFNQSAYTTIKSDSFPQTHPKLAAAEQKFIQAKIAYESALDYAKAHKLMQETLTLDGENPAYQFVAAMIALKARQFSTAKKSLNVVIKQNDAHLALLGRYYLGRVLADEGDKRRAAVEFEHILKTASKEQEPKLRAAAKIAYDKCQTIWGYGLNTKTLGLMMQQADMLEY